MMHDELYDKWCMTRMILILKNWRRHAATVQEHLLCTNTYPCIHQVIFWNNPSTHPFKNLRFPQPYIHISTMIFIVFAVQVILEPSKISISLPCKPCTSHDSDVSMSSRSKLHDPWTGDGVDGSSRAKFSGSEVEFEAELKSAEKRTGQFYLLFLFLLLLVVGCWLLAVGCWLLAAGCWLLVVGCWLFVVGVVVVAVVVVAAVVVVVVVVVVGICCCCASCCCLFHVWISQNDT